MVADEVVVNLRIRQPNYPAVYMLESYRPIILSPISENSESLGSIHSASSEKSLVIDYADPKEPDSNEIAPKQTPNIKISTKNIRYDPLDLSDETTPKPKDYSNKEERQPSLSSSDSLLEYDSDLEMIENDNDLQTKSIVFDTSNLGSKSMVIMLALIPYFHFFISPGFIPLVIYLGRMWIYCQIGFLYVFLIRKANEY